MLVLEMPVSAATGGATLDEPRARLAHSGFGRLQTLGDGVVGLAIGTAENSARPRTQGCGQQAAAGKGSKLRTFLIREQKIGFWSGRQDWRALKSLG